MKSVVRSLLFGLAFALPMAGCHGNARPQAATPSGPVKQYAVKGIIVGTDPADGEVTVDSEAIPGFMEAMTMPYKVKNSNILQDLHPGDHMTGVLLVGDDSTLLDQIVITAQAQPDYKPQAQYHVPAPGDVVPDFRLTNQSGRQISFRQFRGKALLITFIYTRCPLSDYCPRMSRNFAQIDKALRADPAMYKKTHLLSISFDPAYDSPAVLRSYGEAYTGNFTKEKFEHWDFAAPAKADLPKLLEFFDVGATPGENHTITHSLSTVVIAPDGKVAQWYPTNDWKPEDVLNELKKAAAEAKA
jgi:protein SCO1/2